jgi:thymidylate synthase (FAD)
VVSFTLQGWLYVLNLCDLIWPHLREWTPEIAEWYEKSRLHRARLAP